MNITEEKIWFIGELVPELPDHLLPTHLRILNAVFYQQIVKKKSFPRAITIVAESFEAKFDEILTFLSQNLLPSHSTQC
jgi:hypothetical protein